MSSLKSIITSICLIITNALLGHYYPPTSIFLTPVILGIITFLLANADIKIYHIVLLIIIALTSNDILIKLTAGGTSDFEGAGLINLIFIVTVLIVTIITFSILFNKQKTKAITVILVCLLIPTTSYLYISYFDFLGLVDYQNTSKTKAIAIKDKVFLDDLKFSVNPIIYKSDTLKIINGWAEKQIIVNHEHLIKKYNDTSIVNYTIKLIANKSFDDLDLRYNINDKDVSGTNPVDSTISFNCPKSAKTIIVYFFKDDTIVNKLIVNN